MAVVEVVVAVVAVVAAGYLSSHRLSLCPGHLATPPAAFVVSAYALAPTAFDVWRSLRGEGGVRDGGHGEDCGWAPLLSAASAWRPVSSQNFTIRVSYVGLVFSDPWPRLLATLDNRYRHPRQATAPRLRRATGRSGDRRCHLTHPRHSFSMTFCLAELDSICIHKINNH